MRPFHLLVPPALLLILGCTGVLGDTGDDLFGGGGEGNGGGEEEPAVDRDEDGYSEEVDCDDENADVHPDATEVQGNGVDDDCDPGTCIRSGFNEEVREVTLPATYGVRGTTPFYSIYNSDNCDSESMRPESGLLDFTGDGVVDLVILQDCEDSTVGDEQWLVHAGSRDGFAADATSWSLPASYGKKGTTPFYSLANTDNCDASYLRPESAVTDINSDGTPDLVITQSCEESNVGDTRWLVHLGGGSGFADEASDWTLPAEYGKTGTTPFYSFANSDNCDASYLRPESTLADLSGDGKADLVLTTVCDASDVGDTRWVVHQNSGSGFGEAADWALPGTYGAKDTRPFYALANTDNCDASSLRPESTLSDLDGDGRSDLVLTQVCDDTKVGDTEWWVHRNSGSGFAEEASTWELPAAYGVRGTKPFYALANSDNCDTESMRPESVVSDLDGDGQPDLVITTDCEDDNVGDTTWTLHAGVDGGFETGGRPWSLPATYGVRGTHPFYAMAVTDNCDTETLRPEAYTLDIDGSGEVDLVITTACEDDTVGDTTWWMHASYCDE